MAEAELGQLKALPMNDGPPTAKPQKGILPAEDTKASNLSPSPVCKQEISLSLDHLTACTEGVLKAEVSLETLQKAGLRDARFRV